MTHNFDVLDCLIESLWHYGIPPPPPPPPTSAPAQIIGLSTTSIPSNYILCTDRDSFGSPNMALPDQLADADAATRLAPGSLPHLFNVLDEDGDGRLSLRDMCSLVARLGMSAHADSFQSLINSTLSNNNNIPQQHQQITQSSTHDDEYLLPSLTLPQFSQLYASLFAGPDPQLLAVCQMIENPAHDQDADDQYCIDIHDEDLLHAFHVYDTNRDGFISAAELAAVLLELRLLPAAAAGGRDHQHGSIDAQKIILGKCQAYIDSVDLDGNGMVDLQEFKAMMSMHNNIALTAAST